MDELRTNARKLSSDEQYQIRRNIFCMLKKGYKPNQVVEALGISRSLVYATKKSCDEGSINTIKPQTRGRRTGEKLVLTLEQEKTIRQTIIDKNPEHVKLKCCMWTRRAIHDYILRDFGIDMPLSTLGYYLDRWGFSVQRPAKEMAGQDAVCIEKWMEEKYTAIKEGARGK